MTEEEILTRRMHGLYLSRRCESLAALARHLMGMHCWFHRNVMFSAVIRGADLIGWRTELTKTWLYRGTLHGVAYDDLPTLLALHDDGQPLTAFEAEVVRYMEDGVFSRAEFRRLFADRYDERFIARAFSPWGGVFVGLARKGRVAFRDMTSRDFDMIDAEPTRTRDEVLPDLLGRYFAAYGPATLADAAWFFGFSRGEASRLPVAAASGLRSFGLGKSVYYYADGGDMAAIPEVTLLSGFDPLIESYTDRAAVLPAEYKAMVILKSGICLPTIAVNGRVAGLWNIKKNEPVVEFFAKQPKRVERAAMELADAMRWRTERYL